MTAALGRALEQIRARSMHREFVFYVVIGVLTQIVDIVLFLLFVHARITVEIATTMSVTVATAMHFTLNKYLNFKKHDRHVGHQLRTYLAVCAISLSLQIAIVSVLSRFLHLSPFEAKIIGNGANFPINFVLHRYFTFGLGIRASIGAWWNRRADFAAAKAVARTEIVP